MRIRTPLAKAAAGVGLLICALGPVASAAGPGGTVLTGYGTSAQSGSSGQDAGLATTSNFTISGNVGGLWPGVALWLHLTVTNPMTTSITVTSITTVVGNASLFCKASNLKVSTYTGTLHVAAGKKATIAVFAHMFHSAPNFCEGKTFPLTYTGTGTSP